MRMILFLFFLGLLISPVIPIHNHDKELIPYLDSYFEIINKVCDDSQYNYPAKTRLVFTDTLDEEEWAAQCYSTMGYWEIKIKRDKYNSMSENNKQTMVYHELSHCILKNIHVENEVNYMYYRIIDLEPNVLTQQVLEDAWNLCGKK